VLFPPAHRGVTGNKLAEVISLKECSPLASGKTQAVYQHPMDPNRLIKVRNLDKLQKKYDSKLGGLIGYTRRHGLYTTWQREMEHYFSVCLRLGRRPRFLQDYQGIVDTDLGLGMVVGRLTDRSGSLAPTLEQVVLRTGLTAQIRADVEELRRQVNELRISTNDVSVKNIVYAWDEFHKDHLVMIEGLGVNTFIPVARYSNFFNVRSNNRHFARTVESLEKLNRRHAIARSAPAG
jgi:hypothetical protein